MKAIKTTATIENDKYLLLDKPLPVYGKGKVRLIVLLPEEDDIAESEWLNAAATNPAFNFLKEPEEDIYNITDGKPFKDKR